jgi:hypothetical protein
MSRFAFLQAEFPDIFAHVARAETLANGDPRPAAFYGRLALETAVGLLYRHDGTLKDQYDPMTPDGLPKCLVKFKLTHYPGVRHCLSLNFFGS